MSHTADAIDCGIPSTYVPAMNTVATQVSQLWQYERVFLVGGAFETQPLPFGFLWIDRQACVLSILDLERNYLEKEKCRFVGPNRGLSFLLSFFINYLYSRGGAGGRVGRSNEAGGRSHYNPGQI